MKIKSNKIGFWKRLFGICLTQLPANLESWKYENGLLIVDLSQTPELSHKAGAIRIEDEKLPNRVLVVHGDDDKYYAYQNRCMHAKRRMDPVPESNTIQCCSVGKATYDYDGKLIHGSAKGPLTIYPVDHENGKLFINIEK